MWGTILKFVPAIFSVFSSGSGLLAKKTGENKGATLATLLGAGGLFSNPDVRNFVAEMLIKAAELMTTVP